MKADSSKTGTLEPIAIIGMAGRFGGTENLQDFWKNLAGGIKSESDRARADLFDAEFFGLNTREAELLDPQQRIFLECAWEAVEGSGHDLTSSEEPVGVFASSGINTYLLEVSSGGAWLPERNDLQLILENSRDDLANRISDQLNLRGPSITVHAGNSSSLIAIATACRSLLSFECDFALAGAAAIGASMGAGVLVLRRLRDAMADRDAIRALICATAVNHSGKQEPCTKPDLHAQAEVIALAQVLAGISPESISYVEMHSAGEPAADTSEIGALLRVFQENSKDGSWCALGSVKGNIGDLEAASGIAGIIKTVLALEHRQLPPAVNFREVWDTALRNGPFYINSTLQTWPDLAKLRCAGVSSFSSAGANAHIILQEAPQATISKTWHGPNLLVLSAKTNVRLQKFSGRLAEFLQSSVDLNDICYTLQAGRKHFEWRATVVCTDAQDAIRQLMTQPLKAAPARMHDWNACKPVFLFPGLGNQYVGMASRLYDKEPFFTMTVDSCCQGLKPILATDLRETILAAKPADAAKSKEAIDFAHMVSPHEVDTAEDVMFSQPALFVIEYSLGRLLQYWGVTASAMAGYSIGEYVAACLAEVFTIEDALRIVAQRSLLAQSLPESRMLAVPMSEAQVRGLTNDQIRLCGIHGPQLCVLGGVPERIAELQNDLVAKGVVSRQLKTTRAFHTNLMLPIAPALKALLAKVSLRAPSIPYVSNVTGRWIEPSQATNPEYWASHLCSPVRFSDAIMTIVDTGRRLFVEVGPGRSLSGLAMAELVANRIRDAYFVPTLPSMYDNTADEIALLQTIADLWKHGVEFNWKAVHEGRNSQRVPLPCSEFERRSYWLLSGSKKVPSVDSQKDQDSKTESRTDETAIISARRAGPTSQYAPHATAILSPVSDEREAAATGSANLNSEGVLTDATPTIRRLVKWWSEKLNHQSIGVNDDFFELGGDSLIAMQILNRVRQELGVRVELRSFLAKPTIAALAGHIDGLAKTTWAPENK